MYKPPFHVFAELDGPGSYSVIDEDAREVCLCSSGVCADFVAEALNRECERCKRLDETLQDSLRALALVVRELIQERDAARSELSQRPAGLLGRVVLGDVRTGEWSCVVLGVWQTCIHCARTISACETAYYGMGKIPGCYLCVSCYDKDERPG